MRHLLIIMLFSSILSVDADGDKDAEIQSMPAEETEYVILRDDTSATPTIGEVIVYPIEDFIQFHED